METISKHSKLFGIWLVKTLEEKLIGRFASPKAPQDAAALAHFFKKCQGPYLEIGVLWGGSLVVAGLCMPGQLYGIDPLHGYDTPGRLDPYAKPEFPTSPDVVYENLETFDLLDRTTLFIHKHPPYPPAIEDVKLEVAYIDGSHAYEAAKLDWLGLKDRVTKYILFHDLHHRGPSLVFTEASNDPDWEIAYHGLEAEFSCIGVLKRK